MAKQASNTGKKPNIVILWGDDIGTWNISYFSRGMMGYRTPNIDLQNNNPLASHPRGSSRRGSFPKQKELLMTTGNQNCRKIM